VREAEEKYRDMVEKSKAEAEEIIREAGRTARERADSILAHAAAERKSILTDARREAEEACALLALEADAEALRLQNLAESNLNRAIQAVVDFFIPPSGTER